MEVGFRVVSDQRICMHRMTATGRFDSFAHDRRTAGFGAELTLSESRLSDGFAPKAVSHTATRSSGGSMPRIRGRTCCAGWPDGTKLASGDPESRECLLAFAKERLGGFEHAVRRKKRAENCVYMRRLRARPGRRQGYLAYALRLRRLPPGASMGIQKRRHQTRTTTSDLLHAIGYHRR
jgi:hypothetical protein